MDGFLNGVTNVNNAVNGVVWGVPALALLAFVGILVSRILPKKGSSNTTEPIPVVEVKSDAEIAKAYFPEDYIGYRYPVLPTMSTWPYGNHADTLAEGYREVQGAVSR